MIKFTVGMATCGVSAGSAKVLDALKTLAAGSAGKASVGSTRPRIASGAE